MYIIHNRTYLHLSDPDFLRYFDGLTLYGKIIQEPILLPNGKLSNYDNLGIKLTSYDARYLGLLFRNYANSPAATYLLALPDSSRVIIFRE